LDDQLSLSLKGEKRNGFAMSNPTQLKRSANNPILKKIANDVHHAEEENIAYLYKTLIDTQSSADYLFEQSKVSPSKKTYPQHPFGRDMKLIAELITADTDTKIYYASLGSFDTHANQKNQQARLLKIYADAIAALTDDLKSNGLFDETLIMTFSEFGRRVKQNGSNGTDHGTANNVFLMGGKLKNGGVINQGPDLSRLENGDLIYDIDFRQIYATILENWLGTDSRIVLNEKFDLLSFI